MIDKFMDWCHSIDPPIVGFIVYITISFTCVAFIIMAIALITFITNGYVLLLVPAVILYSFYVAIFKQ